MTADPSPETDAAAAFDPTPISDDRPFEMPPKLAEAFRQGELVIFAGAGVSTETRRVFPFTLYEYVAAQLDVDPAGGPSFPALMTRYEREHGRMALMELIKSRFDHAKSFPEIDQLASRFHRALSSAFTIREIVTTNWDDYFERRCGATPFVTEADWAFWQSSYRKVFKVHGSIASPGSVIATEADYARCQQDLLEGLIGSALRSMLATKTVVFVGYSFGDSDFNAIYEVFKQRMSDFLPRAYIVTLDPRDPPQLVSEMHVIRTDATYFVQQLKQEYEDDRFIPDERAELVRPLRDIVWHKHRQLLDRSEMRDDPELAIVASYQDGIIHALDNQLARRPSGIYSSRAYVEQQMDVYEDIGQQLYDAGRYLDVAYVQGYGRGLEVTTVDDLSEHFPFDLDGFPLYYVFGHDERITTYDEYVRAKARAPELDPDAHAYAARIVSRLAPGVVLQHSAFLTTNPRDARFPRVR